MRRRTDVLNETMAVYHFGNTPLAFESEDDVWLSCLHERYGSFEDSSRENAFLVHFESTAPPPPPTLTSPFSTHIEAPTIESSERGFTARTLTTSADVDLAGRRAHLRGPRALYPLDNLLRHLLPALGEQGVLFHGATLAKASEGVLACGASGAGKTTLARLAHEHALCDELSAVHPSTDGCHVTSLPFWRARPGTARLKAVLLLRHGREHRIEPLSGAKALRTISRQVLWPVEIPHAMDRALDHVSTLLREVPIYELAFRPEPDAWDFIVERVLQ